MSKNIIQQIVALAGKKPKVEVPPPTTAVPPKGAPTNLRPGGAHIQQKDRPRAVKKKKAIEDGWD